jgi:hypothetical protein
MNKIIKAIITVTMALVMAVSSLVVVSAEVTEETVNNSITTSITDDGDGTRAYQLVWKYKESNGHIYKRRWNATLGIWYDPDWIFVQ